jgi:hypothetical protein
VRELVETTSFKYAVVAEFADARNATSRGLVLSRRYDTRSRVSIRPKGLSSFLYASTGFSDGPGCPFSGSPGTFARAYHRPDCPTDVPGHPRPERPVPTRDPLEASYSGSSNRAQLRASEPGNSRIATDWRPCARRVYPPCTRTLNTAADPQQKAARYPMAPPDIERAQPGIDGLNAFFASAWLVRSTRLGWILDAWVKRMSLASRAKLPGRTPVSD